MYYIYLDEKATSLIILGFAVSSINTRGLIRLSIINVANSNRLFGLH